MTLALADLEVLVVDCQSTGQTPAHGVLLELGWCRARASDSAPPRVTAHLTALPDGTRIPPAVTRVTGIRHEHLTTAVPVEHAYLELLAAAAQVPPLVEGRTPVVIHYASFERVWLEHLKTTLAGGHVGVLELMCTHEIAKRLLDLPRQGLRPLAGYFGLGKTELRRSAGHVAATAFVWRHLVLALAAVGVSTWSELTVWLSETPPVSRKARTLPLPRARRLALPDAPGVYRMLRHNGDVLYVGKATSLKKRVNSYFTKRRGHTERTMEMLTQVRDVSVTVTETALEAALLETDAIKRERPPYNVQLSGETREAWFSATDLSDAAPRPDDRFRLGPLPSRWALAPFAALRELVVEGRAPDRWRLARATAVPPAFGPGEPEFLTGLSLFAARHGVERFSHAALMSASKRLLALSRAGTLDEGDTAGEAERVWDPERVARHLERVVLHAGQLVRRARWLTLLSEASVSWLSSDRLARRVLVLERAEVVERALVPVDAEPPEPPGAGRDRRARQASFDVAAYDRLRVLGTELKRIAGEGRAVDVRLSARVTLRGRRLGRLLDRV